MSQGHGSPIVPSHSLVRPYYACKSRIRYVVLARGGHSEKFVWSMLTIAVDGRGARDPYFCMAVISLTIHVDLASGLCV